MRGVYDAHRAPKECVRVTLTAPVGDYGRLTSLCKRSPSRHLGRDSGCAKKLVGEKLYVIIAKNDVR